MPSITKRGKIIANCTVMRQRSKMDLPFTQLAISQEGWIMNRRSSRSLELGDLSRGDVIFFGDPSYA